MRRTLFAVTLAALVPAAARAQNAWDAAKKAAGGATTAQAREGGQQAAPRGGAQEPVLVQDGDGRAGEGLRRRSRSGSRTPSSTRRRS